MDTQQAILGSAVAEVESGARPVQTGPLTITSARFGTSAHSADSIDVLDAVTSEIRNGRISLKVGRFGKHRRKPGTPLRRLFIEYSLDGVVRNGTASVVEGKKLAIP